MTFALNVFFPCDSGTWTVQAEPDSVAGTPFTVTAATPDPALAVPVTATDGAPVTVPARGEVMLIVGARIASSAWAA